MDQSDTLEQAAQFARQALNLMEERAIAATPDNFTIWYLYYAGREPKMNQALDALLQGDAAISEERCAEIHREFLSGQDVSAVVHEAATVIKQELNEILKRLGTAGDDAAQYGRTLDTFAEQVAGADDGEALGTVLSDIVTATRAMERQNNDLEQQLATSSSEISSLREDLEDVRREAITDAMTGIFNRRFFDIRLREEATAAEENGRDLCLLMIDIDNFKNFNDTFGHLIGDLILKLLANMLTDTIKGRDTASRYGGEEFAVILPETSLQNAFKVAETIQNRIKEKELKNRSTGENMGRVTVSIGVGCYLPGEDLSDFIARADKALYTAKHAGRDRVVTERLTTDTKKAAKT
ncbi:MAG: GGDEF domain-containing protein [Rhodospirillales bacterium]|nr:GGDEF domain-containing protein [Rhodospirillales bacterium]